MLSVRASCRLGDFVLDVAFEGPADGITVLFGPSGAGKSATLSIISGALRPSSGRVALGARLLTDTDARVHVPQERRRIGLVDQNASLFPHMPVRANLLYGWRRARGERRIAFDAVVETLSIGHLLDRRPAHLSGGERQRVAFGRALLSQPELLLLDEPVSALDAERRGEVLTYIAELKRVFLLPMVYVTHSVTEAQLLADVVVRLAAGHVVATGSQGAVLQGALAGVVASHEGPSTCVTFDGAVYKLPRIDAAPGTPLRVKW